MTGQHGMIPEDIIEEVIARNDIAAVVGQYVRFAKSSGQNQFALCPFHSEDTPSFSVSSAKQLYYCFGCHKGGNVINFIMEIEKINYPQAIRLLAERANISIPEPQDDQYLRASNRRKTIQAALLDAARYYYRNLITAHGDVARAYLDKRQIHMGSAKAFGLGFAKKEWKGLYTHLNQKGYADDVLASSGLFTKSKTGDLLDLFRGRLMFPIFDVLGKVVAFGGRVLDDEQPKYINSPESEVYSKQNHLYGLNFAKTSKADRLIIVEGYMDVIAMHQAGVKNTAACLGTALTQKQLRLIGRFTKDVVLFYDSDQAGQNAAVRGLKMLLQMMQDKQWMDMKVAVAMVPDGKDPDEYIRLHGTQAFLDILDEAYAVIEYLLLIAEKDSQKDGVFDPQTYQKLACMYLDWEKNPVLRERAATRVATRLSVSVESVLAQTQRLSAISDIPDRRPVPPVPSDTLDKRTYEELTLLCIMAGLECELPDPPTIDDFTSPHVMPLAQRATNALSEKKLSVARLLQISEGETLMARPTREVLAEIIVKSDASQTLQTQDERYIYVQGQVYSFRVRAFREKRDELASMIDRMPPGDQKQEAKRALFEVERFIDEIEKKKKELRG